MEQNRDPGNQARVDGAPPAYPPQQPPSQGYVPPPNAGPGEPTRQWSQLPQQPQPVMNPPAMMPDRRPHHRTPIVGPVLLIGAGLVFLLINLGVLDQGVWV